MRVSINQPRYMPFLGYLHRMMISDVFVYLDCVQFAKNDFENRNKIRTPQGSTWLTVPVNAPLGTPIPEVSIDNEQRWQTKHWGTLLGYKKAPNFSEFSDRIERLFQSNWTHLIDLNFATVDTLIAAFGITPPRIVRATELGVSGSGSQLLFDICSTLGATTYISGAPGRDYLDLDLFRSENIEVVFHDYRHPEYPQHHGGFEPYMAAVDLLFNCGRDGVEILSSGQPELASV